MEQNATQTIEQAQQPKKANRNVPHPNAGARNRATKTLIAAHQEEFQKMLDEERKKNPAKHCPQV